MVAKIDIFLTLEQFKQAVPNTMAEYLPFGTRVVFDTVTLPISDIVGISEKPLSLLRWDHSSETLSQVSQEVSSYKCIFAN